MATKEMYKEQVLLKEIRLSVSGFVEVCQSFDQSGFKIDVNKVWTKGLSNEVPVRMNFDAAFTVGKATVYINRGELMCDIIFDEGKYIGTAIPCVGGIAQIGRHKQLHRFTMLDIGLCVQGPENVPSLEDQTKI